MNVQSQIEIPRTMRAAILVEQRRPLVLDAIRLPESLEFGQVLVKVLYSGVCGSQIGEIDGVKGEDKYLPHLLGHEGSGIVMGVGPGCKTVASGDRVVMHWMQGTGIQAGPPAYEWNGRKLNAGWITSFNEYAIVSENRLTPVPSDFDLEAAALFGCAVTTGLGVITNNAKLQIGESIVVFGAGGVGLNVIQGASLVTAYPIIAVDRYDAKLEIARRFGATHTLNAREQDLHTELSSILDGPGADVAVDNTGNTDMIQLAYRCTHPKGRIVLVGVPPKGHDIAIDSMPLHFGKIITGSHGGECRPGVDIPRYTRLAEAGRLNLSDTITDRASLEQINDVIDRMRSGRIAGRCVLRVASDE